MWRNKIMLKIWTMIGGLIYTFSAVVSAEDMSENQVQVQPINLLEEQRTKDPLFTENSGMMV